MKEKVCKNCKWFYDEVCVNDKSDMCADFVCLDYYCKEFERKKDERDTRVND